METQVPQASEVNSNITAMLSSSFQSPQLLQNLQESQKKVKILINSYEKLINLFLQKISLPGCLSKRLIFHLKKVIDCYLYQTKFDQNKDLNTLLQNAFFFTHKIFANNYENIHLSPFPISFDSSSPQQTEAIQKVLDKLMSKVKNLPTPYCLLQNITQLQPISTHISEIIDFFLTFHKSIFFNETQILNGSLLYYIRRNGIETSAQFDQNSNIIALFLQQELDSTQVNPQSSQ